MTCCFDLFGPPLGTYIFDSTSGNAFKYSFDKAALADLFARYVLSKQRIYILLSSFCNYLDLLSTLIGLKTRLNLSKYVMPTISFKIKCEKFAVLANVYQNSQSLFISRCCFAEDG